MPRADQVAVVLGTRPEIVKLAGVITALGSDGYIVHTGQHYDDSLSAQFFATYDLPQPEVKLEDVGGRSRAAQFAAIIGQLGEQFAERPPVAVVVQGDTNTAAAAAQAASFLGIPVVHVEAGLRSYDRAMPEEINRALVGVVADLHCAPTGVAAAHLIAEGVDPARIVMTGNTVVEATLRSLPGPVQRARLLDELDLDADGYLLATIHRPENTDDPDRLRCILYALAGAGVPVSGGIQEECTVLKRPLLVVRNSTERPEAIDAGFARRIVPDDALAQHLADALADHSWAARLATVPSPYGDGTASQQIVDAIRRIARPA
jgi:UDP-N-acetylglucosamine 2-epimerase (non-hydrolysing)